MIVSNQLKRTKAANVKYHGIVMNLFFCIVFEILCWYGLSLKGNDAGGNMNNKIFTFKKYNTVIFLSLMPVTVCPSLVTTTTNQRVSVSHLSIASLSQSDDTASNSTSSDTADTSILSQPSAEQREASRILRKFDLRIWQADTIEQLDSIIFDIIQMQRSSGNQPVYSDMSQPLTLGDCLDDLLGLAENRKQAHVIMNSITQSQQ